MNYANIGLTVVTGSVGKSGLYISGGCIESGHRNCLMHEWFKLSKSTCPYRLSNIHPGYRKDIPGLPPPWRNETVRLEITLVYSYGYCVCETKSRRLLLCVHHRADSDMVVAQTKILSGFDLVRAQCAYGNYVFMLFMIVNEAIYHSKEHKHLL
jgi:hypothetical protein